MGFGKWAAGSPSGQAQHTVVHARPMRAAVGTSERNPGFYHCNLVRLPSPRSMLSTTAITGRIDAS